MEAQRCGGSHPQVQQWAWKIQGLDFLYFYFILFIYFLFNFLTVLHGMWDLTSPTRDRTLQWKHRILITGPPGKSQGLDLTFLGLDIDVAYGWPSSHLSLPPSLPSWAIFLNDSQVGAFLGGSCPAGERKRLCSELLGL